MPVDPFAIARRAGVDVIDSSWDMLSIGFSGKYSCDSGRPTIEFNGTEVGVRRRFTIAHELGHHFLKHGSRPRDGRQTFSINNYDPEEAAANRFAASLLMPREEVTRAVNRGKGLAELARLFDVSEVAMQIRLKSLGYLRG